MQEARAALEPFGVAAEQPRVRSARVRVEDPPARL